MLNIFQTSSNNSTALRMQNRGVVSIFGAGYPGCDLAAWVPNAPKMEGESKGGDLPSWHTTFGESLVCYTFCPGWRGKGAARSGAVTFPHQEIRQWDGAAAIIPLPDFGRGKRYISPRPSSLVPPQRHRQRTNFPICEPPVRVRVQDHLLAACIIRLGQIFKKRNQPAPELCQLLRVSSIVHCM